MLSFASGDVRVGGGAAASLITGVGGGIDAKMTTGWLNNLSFDIVTGPDVADWSDLEGRAVGISRAGSQTYIAARLVLEANGVDPADVDFLEVGGEPERLAALRTGQVQMAPVNPAARTTATGAGLTVLLASEDNDVPFQASGLVAATSLLEDDPDTAAAVVRAVLRGAAATKDPEQEDLIRATIDTYLAPETEAEADAIYAYVSQDSPVVYPPDGHVNLDGVASILEISATIDEATRGHHHRRRRRHVAHRGGGRGRRRCVRMSRLRLSLAIGDYDHVRDLYDGDVAPEGIDLVVQRLPVEEVFYRFTRHREWDVSEMSLAKYVGLRSAGDVTLSAVPVFPSRAFRRSAVYVRSDRAIEAPADLVGCRVGVPEWVQTAGVWVRGILADDYGLDLASIEWVQAGVNEPGRVEKVLATLPTGVTVKALPDRSLSELLASGDIDAAISARPPASFLSGVAPVRRLWPDPIGVDRCWWAATGIFPIMHVVAIRAEVLHDHPWVARNLLSAFEEAKRRSVERLGDITVSRLPLPWTAEHVANAVDLAGGDPFPYGIEPNRAVLDRFLRHAADQGVVTRDVAVDDLFWPTVHGDVRV